MSKFFILTVLLFSSIFTYAQNPKITWGDEFKLKKGSTDLEVLTVDNSGVYLRESHYVLKSYFVIGASVRTSASLIKLDKNFIEQYHSDFNDELRGKEYESFFTFQNKMFILSSDYEKREKKLTLYTAEIDKSTGKLSGDWVELTNWIKEEKGNDINFKMTYNEDSTKMVLVSSVEGNEKNTYQIQEFDKNLNSSKPVTISNEFEGKTYQLERCYIHHKQENNSCWPHLYLRRK